MVANWTFWATGGLLGLLGVLLLWRSLLADRARGRRRCPRCWYDLSHTPGLRCSECGYVAKRESRLHRSRRRWRLAGLAVLMLLGGTASALTPRVRSEGFMSLIPTTALIVGIPGMDDLTELDEIRARIYRAGCFDGYHDWSDLSDRQHRLMAWRCGRFAIRGNPPALRIAALDVLLDLDPEDESTRRALNAALRDPDSEISLSAIDLLRFGTFGLARWGEVPLDDRSLQIVLDRADDPDPRVRLAYLRALRNDAHRHRDLAIPVVLDRLDDPDENVRIAAEELRDHLQSPRAAPTDELIQMIMTGCADDPCAAIEALTGREVDDRYLEPLIEFCLTVNSAAGCQLERDLMFWGWSDLAPSPDTVVSIYSGYLHSDDEETRMYGVYELALLAWGEPGFENAVPCLMDRVDSAGDAERRNVLLALASVGSLDREDAASVARFISHPDPIIRKLALWSACTTDDLSEVNVTLMQRGLLSPDGDVRFDAARGLYGMATGGDPADWPDF